MKFTTTFLFAFIIHCGFAQVDLGEIKKLTKDSASVYFYDTLVHHFQTEPHTFEMTKSLNLYYGKLYSPYYKMYHVGETETMFNQLVSNGKLRKAVLLGEEILKDDPVNLEVLLKMTMCYGTTDNPELLQLTKAKIAVLYKAILHSGSGESMESTLKVVAVGDEYAMMALLGIQGLTRQSTMNDSSVIDSWKIRDQRTGAKKEMHFELLMNKDAMPDFGK